MTAVIEHVTATPQPDFWAAVDETRREQLIADLKAARSELVRRGRCREVFVDLDGHVCTLGAIGVAVVNGFDSLSPQEQGMEVCCDPRIRRAALELARHLTDWESVFEVTGVDLVWEFNDIDGVADQDVFDLIDKTLADLGGLA